MRKPALSQEALVYLVIPTPIAKRHRRVMIMDIGTACFIGRKKYAIRGISPPMI